MKIQVLLSPLNADELYFTGKTTVVIDVLRATTSIIYALNNGAREIIPVNTIEFAMKVSGNAFGGSTLLAGERNAKKIDGFSLGNSPLEFTEEVVKNKSIILYTTNGSRAVVRAKFSENLYICSFNNLPGMAEFLVSRGNDVTILCSGWNGMFCMEDTVCAGRLVSELMKAGPDSEISDAARAALILNEPFSENYLNMLTDTEHGKLLKSKGFEDDLEAACRFGSTDIIPVYSGGTIKAYSG